MFDGTELSLVYGDMQEPETNIQHNNIQPTQNTQQQNTQPPNPEKHPYQQPETIYQQQPVPKVIYKEHQISFWDKLGQTKGDVFKLFLFALVILIAISFDRLIFTYLKQYIDHNTLNSTNEFIIRLAYPIGVIVVIWLLKSI
jgi:uncharacterized membrane protein YraQ (UPF0718 family)|tara:strand:+ start:341 stop:766 length:426 start_codon:yes stop_codon:yes gene_type:complete